MQSTCQVRRPAAFQAASARSVCCRAIKSEDVHKTMSNALMGLAAVATLMGAPALAPPPVAPAAQALLTAGDPVKNARAILRNALPIDCKPIRTIQVELESIAEALRIPGSKSLNPISRSVRKAEATFTKDYNKIVAAFAPDRKDEGIAALEGLKAAFAEFDKVLEDKDKQEVPIIQQKCLRYVGDAEEAMVKGFPFEVPAEYSDYAQLKGRATLEMNYTLNESRDTGGKATRTMTIVLDGYNAPVSAGNFIDLVQRKWYDGMEIQRADGFVVQTGKPKKGENFVDPDTGKVRTIPLEVKVAGEKEPIYEFNLEEIGRPNAQPAIPFNAFGTMAWARAEFENNSASSQVFWLLKESELTPSGANLLDGRYAVFGYIVEGQDDLLEMKVGDKINYIKVVKGLENYIPGKKAAPAASSE